MGGFDQVIQSLISQIINIPLINPLSFVYVVLNALLLLFSTFLSGSGSSLFGNN
ncbi:MAG TPA: hypothetical protein PKY35_10125 [Candidatus Hydrogenedentes bacterium]|nr:hypothetical protein [Candidatus Hydrogenedentota bacterium]HOL77377.1 hypothetical protein [Candidatus Hydrogenedentota bacterium]HPO84805.1 hypothetical protein [Candidatus Hydrogenedentota bacterium]